MDHPEDLPVLLGDSIFRRLYERNTSLFDSLSGQLCVGGQTIPDLRDKVKAVREQLRERHVIILIGANDILKRVPCENIQLNIRSLIRHLKRLKCRISLCEVLPIPKLGRKLTAASAVLKLNSYLRSFEPSGVHIIHSQEVFCNAGVIKCDLYCKKLGSTGRVDLVHPNASGLDCLLLTLEV